jgi:hypothetical protein
VYFTSEIDTPVGLVIEEPAAEEEVDAWEQAQREVEGQTDGFASILNRSSKSDKIRRWVIESAYINAAVEALIEAVGTYGLRLDQLPGDESIVIGLRCEPGLNLPVIVSADAGNPVTAVAPEATPLGGGSDFVPMTQWRVGSYGSVQRAAVAHVVIQVRKSDVQALQSGGLSKDQFKDRVQVTKY